jgi:transposase
MDTNSIPPKSDIPDSLFDSLPELIRSHIRFLGEINQQQEVLSHQQQVRIQQLEARIHDLETQLSKNSSNSSKPPSSDGLKRKPKSLRGKTDKRPGGQQGHVGKGLEQVQYPDEVVTHVPINCNGCGSN